MKTLMIVLCCASWSWACPKGFEPYHDGVCVATIQSDGVQGDQANWVSDEKPPRHPQANWEKAVQIPVQTWDKNTGGTEVADELRYTKDHPATKSSDEGKLPK